ncbi:ty3-gypsy retrotransposon protein [Tanacetum coccineum]
MADDEQDTKPETEPNIADVVESGDILILNSLIRQGSPRSLQLWGSIGSGTVHVLIDNGSTHNFVRPDIVKKMQLPVQSTKDFKGDESLRIKRISLHHMHALLVSDDVYGIYELYNVTKEAQEVEPPPGETDTTPTKLVPLLDRFGPLFQVPTSLPPHREMEKLVNEMLEQRIIQFSQSPFSSPVLLVMKKDGSYRFYVDYRALNEVKVKDKFPIPTTDEMFDEVGGAVIFTKLDLRAGYHQIRVHERDIYKTAFRTHDGHYEFLDMPFGLTNAPSTFQAPMNRASTLEYLGHIISGLGEASRCFIRGYATTTALLTNLLRKGDFKWGEPETKAFEDLKVQLSTTPLLSLPDFEKIIIIETDATDEGIGAVLLQEGRPICYFSRRLGPRMRATETYEKELFAIVEAVFKWRHYLLGRRFVIRTDHKSLKELMQQVIQTPVQHRYVCKLLRFDFKIEYKPGVQNQVADALSRLYEDARTLTASFMAMSQPLTEFIGELKRENKELEELRSQLKALLLREHHDTPNSGHGGVKKMMTKYSTQAIGGYLQPLATSTAIWEDVSMEFITGMPLSKGFTIVLVVVDRFSKYAHFAPLPNSFIDPTVAEVFVETVVKLHGVPKSIVSDRDPVFVSKFWTQLFKLSGTQLNHSIAYHLQTDGQTEVVNHGLEQNLWAMVEDRPTHWVCFLPWAEYCYNTTYHSSIKMTSYQDLYGKVPLAIIPYPQGSSKVAVVDDALRRDVEFTVGDQVLIKLQPYQQITLARQLSNKLAKHYYGPYVILERVGKVAYQLALPADSKIYPVFHVSILKPFVGNNVCEVTELPEEVVEGRPIEQPMAIYGTRVILHKGELVKQVLVQWVDQSLEDATWEALTEF